MKKLLLALLLASATVNASVHDQLVMAIIESDYTTFNTLYSQAAISAKERDSLLSSADQIIPLRQRWIVEHSYYPEIGKDLISAALYAIPTMISIGFFGMGSEMLEKKQDPTIPMLMGCAIFIASIPLAHRSIKKIILAFERPKLLLADAIKIKDLLLNA